MQEIFKRRRYISFFIAEFDFDYLYKSWGSFRQDKLQELLARWQAAENQPFSEVESPYFQELLEYVRQGPLKLPSGLTMKRRMMDLSEKGIQETKAMIKVNT